MTNQNHFLPDNEELRKLIEDAGLAKPKVQWVHLEEEVVKFGPSNQAASNQQATSPDDAPGEPLTPQPKGPVTQRLDAILGSAEEAEEPTASDDSSAIEIPDELQPDAKPGIVTMRLDAFLAAAAVGPKPEEVAPPQSDSEKNSINNDPMESESQEPTPEDATSDLTEEVAVATQDDGDDIQALPSQEASPLTESTAILNAEAASPDAPWENLSEPLEIPQDVEDPLPETTDTGLLASEAIIEFDPETLPRETQPLFEYLLKDCLQVSQSSAGFLSDTDGLILAKLDVPDSLVGLSAILRNTWHQIESYLHKPSVPSISIPIGGSQTLHLLWFSTTLGTMIAGLITRNPIQPIQIIDLRTRCLKTILGFLERTNEH